MTEIHRIMALRGTDSFALASTNITPLRLSSKVRFTVTKLSKMLRIALVCVAFMTLGQQPLYAQAQLDDQRMAAVLNVVSMYLFGRDEPIPLPGGLAIPLGLHELSSATFDVDVSQQIFGQFDLQPEGVEFCFDIQSNAPLSAGDITVEVNGEPATVIEGKDNCYSLSEGQQREVNYIVIRVNNPAITLTVDRVELAALSQSQLGLPMSTRGSWDQAAVRKVLRIFAFGGHATDAQILLWTDMAASDAILEMLNFEEHNLKLSPLAVGESYTDSATEHGTLVEWVTFISDPSSFLPIPTDRRDGFFFDGGDFDAAFSRMITVRGLNPFRQRIGFWETNYHLAVNLDAGVSRLEVSVYYDAIMEAHEAGLPYHEVMGVAAKSAAVAEQYGHDRNEWRYDSNLGEFVCVCNEDFAREIHQLFYGIFGSNDPNHEDVTIPETAKMLTDMPIEATQVVFGTDDHHVADLTILGQTISGADASAKIDNLMPISMQHPESLFNLPVMIVSVLADDNLGESSKALLRASWASMGANKSFLQFIQAYAISNLLHGNQHVKYLTSHERALFMANKHNLDNLEAFFGGSTYNGSSAGKSVGGQINDEKAGEFFRPLHNVFGGQTSSEAADSSLVFEINFNDLTDDEFRLRQRVQCSTCDLGQPWEKKWQTVLPQRVDGNFYLEDVAPWLWNHVVGSMDNYTELERAHMYSILGAAYIDPDDDSDGDLFMDFNLLMCFVEGYQIEEATSLPPILATEFETHYFSYCRRNDQEGDNGEFTVAEIESLNRVYTGQSIADNPLAQAVLNQLGQMTLPLNSITSHGAGATLRKHARERVTAALQFIFTTPFVFVEAQ
ncbi:MAG: hypothetical protein ACI9J2_001983 [Saprospiraceae bacterium]|jgi:hypothetical protein